MTLFEDNAAILRGMADDGSDLGPARSIDFSHVFPDRASADAFAGEAELLGFLATTAPVERDEDPWDVTASKVMVPRCEEITEAEEQLDRMARAHAGRADGWGFFRVN